jgi:putative integral membrane protein (TIGR02587 family)
MLVVLGVLAVPVFALNRTSGFRSRRDTRIRDAADDTIEALAVGIVVTLGVLVLLREITPESALEPSLGKVVYESVPFCLGVGVARHFLSGRRSDDGDEGGADAEGDEGPGGDDELTETPPRAQLHPTIADLAATVLGATFVALSIAPTDEVPMIAAATQPVWLLAFVAASLLASYGIVFVAGFGDQEGRHTQEGPFQRPITETVVSYLCSLGVAAVLLWLFQRGGAPFDDLLTRAVVLGFPAAVGGAAGRLAV